MGDSKFITILVLFFLNFFWMIKLIFGFYGLFLRLELLLFLAMLFLSIIALAGIYSDGNWAWALASIIFAVNLINLAYIYFRTARLFLFTGVILVNIIGFIMSVTNIKSREEEEYDKYEGKVKKGVDKEEVVVEEIKPLKEGEILKTYKPEKPEKKAKKKARKAKK